MPKISPELKAERREVILQAAIDSLLEHGYTGTTTREIGERAALAHARHVVTTSHATANPITSARPTATTLDSHSMTPRFSTQASA